MKQPIASQLSVGARSETGYVRNENQDRMGCVRAAFGDVYIVSDGMGGHRGGALAAELTVQALTQGLSHIRSVAGIPAETKRAFEEANRTVYEQGHSGAMETRGMGATAVVLLVAGSRAIVAHVGDSRAYLFARRELRQLTKDHSRVQRLVDAGMLTAAEAMSHPDASLLERAMGTSLDVTVDISPWIPLHAGDQVLLCSDGLHGYVADSEIGTILGQDATVQELTDQLVNRALQKGGEDNITVQLIEYGRRRKRGWPQVISRFAIVFPIALGVPAGEYRRVGEESGVQIARVDKLPVYRVGERHPRRYSETRCVLDTVNTA
ncbi:protein phosphatase [Nitrosospira sp. Nl5]|uniref:PP2C family protein-serine/threonine phosphatase n=1 Tax=Nitrosospira sp. Nl5 TaxID=200120 RepID=UPI0008844C41|nr:protein phosphatase 2C domain-containing protein [Nitrosospira sp. Nl5]SCX86098.1 protein phosphatase [Nitrosospira sp. Nl5]